MNAILKPTTRQARLRKDRREKTNLKRAWFVDAWRLVDEKEQDIVQPWFNLKREAVTYAQENGIEITNLASFNRKVGRYR